MSKRNLMKMTALFMVQQKSLLGETSIGIGCF
ncbi:hypothetical protein HNR69_001786 [Histophilus somni]|nr:hypothetical protein [Histophilus somni]